MNSWGREISTSDRKQIIIRINTIRSSNGRGNTLIIIL
jgi:hypothetical protein